MIVKEIYCFINGTTKYRSRQRISNTNRKIWSDGKVLVALGNQLASTNNRNVYYNVTII